MYRGEVPKRATVKRRNENEDGSRSGTYHRNPIMDTREYELEYNDGTHDRYFANVIEENLNSQIKSEGHKFLVMEKILYHHKDGTAIEGAEGFTIRLNGNRNPKKTTRGWEMNMRMKKGFSKLVALKDLKEINQVELSEYAVTTKIDHEPAFLWYVLFVLRKRNPVISKLEKKYWRTTHKFGLEVPHSVKRAYKIDAETGIDLWRKAISKKMLKVKIAYKKK